MSSKRQFNYRFDHSEQEIATRRRKSPEYGKNKGLKSWQAVLIGSLLMVVSLFCCTFSADSVGDDQTTSALAASVTRVEHYNFIREIAPIAQKEQKKSGLLSSITIAQACLESDYGMSLLSSKYNNLFGIKAYGNEASVTMSTKEYTGGKWITIQGVFRTYSSWTASVEGHTQLFVQGVTWDPNHYKNVLTATNYETAAKDLQTDGYATDPTYASQLIALIQQYHLDQYD